MTAVAQGREYRDLVIVNPTDKYWTRHRYVLWFGAVGSTFLLVWANSLDDALDEAVDWLAEHKPGYLATEEVRSEYERIRHESVEDPSGTMTDEKAWDQATVDTTCAGNYGDFLHSWAWGCWCIDPTRADILQFLGRSR